MHDIICKCMKNKDCLIFLLLTKYEDQAMLYHMWKNLSENIGRIIKKSNSHVKEGKMAGDGFHPVQ